MSLTDDRAAVVHAFRSVVYVARHGEIGANVANRYAGRSVEPLTELGRAQAEQLAARLAGLGIAAVWTSEIARAVETGAIAAGRLGVTAKLDARLNEIGLGPWEGLTEREVAERYPAAHREWNMRPDLLRVDGRETLDAVRDRSLAVLRDAASAPAPLLLVTHVALMRVIALEVSAFSLARYKAVAIPNAEILAVDLAAAEVRRLGSEYTLREQLAHERPL